MIGKLVLSTIAFSFLSSAYAGEIICNGANVTNPIGWGGDMQPFGKELGNGGNINGLDFYNIARQVVDEVSSQPSLYPELAKGELSCALYTTKIIISEDPLFVEYNNVRQEVVAVNYNTPNRIFIHRKGWLDLNDNQKKSIAFHELLGILGRESTGDYKISSRYFGPHKVALYKCSAWFSSAVTPLEFSISEVTAGTTLDVNVNQQVVERFYIRTSTGTVDLTSPKPDSVVLIVLRLKKGLTDWEGSQQMNFFGVPTLPNKFHLELDKTEPGLNDIILDCETTPN